MAGALMYPTFVEAVGADPNPFTFLGIAVPVFSYADSVFPVILGVGLLAIVYHFIDRFIPDVLKMVLVPMLSLVISVPMTLLVFAPLGAYGGLALADGIVWLFQPCWAYRRFPAGLLYAADRAVWYAPVHFSHPDLQHCHSGL